MDQTDPEALQAEALHELSNGAGGLALVFAASVGAYGHGLEPSPDSLARALDGIYLDAAIGIELDGASLRDAHLVATLVKQRGVAPASADLRFGIDPLGMAAAWGGAAAPWPELAPVFARALRGLADDGFRGPFAVADGRPIHNAGGGEAQELAFVLAAGIGYLRALEGLGISPDDGRRMIAFRLSADADQFLTLAKFRALRSLWARVEDACGLSPKTVTLSAETAWRMMTRRDPYVNILRATIAVAGAGLGGADTISILPFSLAHGLPDRFARRVARNTQLILIEESHLARVTDPAAGAAGLEDLTATLCAAAWSRFQTIEAAGGLWPALQQGLVQREVAMVRAAREAALADGDRLVGTTIYPVADETPTHCLDVARRQPPAPGPAAVEPLTAMRLAEAFE